SYFEQIKLASATPIIVETLKENKFKITKEELEKAITSKTKLFILNSPNNPTGSIYSKKELEQIAQVLVEKNIFCISDEIYEKLIYDDKIHISIASLNDKIKELCLIVNGVSKTYAMTGWRIGYLAGKKEIISAIDTLQSHSTSNPCSISQKAALEAFSYSSQKIETMKKEFEKRRDYIWNFFNTLSNVSCLKPEGAFYLFLDISKLLGKNYSGKKIESAADLAEYLLEKAEVAVVPGEGFGKNDHLRLSYATSMENIINACNRIKKAFEILE
ncbi:MAG: pyridoxal phosphate-dependent aminotransferase, partial [bacterium]